jgi:hypothetical protein
MLKGSVGVNDRRPFTPIPLAEFKGNLIRRRSDVFRPGVSAMIGGGMLRLGGEVLASVLEDDAFPV